METQSTIKRNVMRRVYFVHTGRKFLQPRVMKLGLLFLFVLVQSMFVSIPHIISNVGNPAHSFSGLYTFFISAFMNTEITVQLLSIAIAVAGVLFIADFFRNSKVLSPQLS